MFIIMLTPHDLFSLKLFIRCLTSSLCCCFFFFFCRRQSTFLSLHQYIVTWDICTFSLTIIFFKTWTYSTFWSSIITLKQLMWNTWKSWKYFFLGKILIYNMHFLSFIPLMLIIIISLYADGTNVAFIQYFYSF